MASPVAHGREAILRAKRQQGNGATQLFFQLHSALHGELAVGIDDHGLAH